MNAETFFEHFETFTESPNGVAKLRELILQLAVQGKLVPQDLNDEPATRLLERVIAAKPKDTGSTRSKSACPVAERTSNLMSFEVPSTWTWCRLEDIAPNVQYGYTASADASLRGIRLLRITDIQNNMVDWPSVPGCEIDENTYQSYSLHEDDIVIARTGGTIGKSFLVQGISVRAVFASYLIRVTPSDELHAPYIKRFLESPTYWTQLQAMSAGTGQPNVNGTSLKSLLVPLPPLAEQRRIVEKVDQLLRLCDELATRQAAKREVRTALVGATLDRVVSVRTADEFSAQAKRLRNNFDLLFDTPTTIPQLRQTILQLAVQGQLVCDGGVRSDWTTKKLDELVDPDFPISYGVLKPGPHDSKGVPLVKSQHIRDWRVSEQIDDWISHELDTQFRRTRIKGGEILLNLVGASIGRCAIAPMSLKGANVSRAVAVITLQANVDARFVLMMLTAVFTPSWISSTCSGSAQPVFNLGDVKKVEIPVPPFSEQKRIVSKVTELLSLCDSLEAKLTQAESASTQLLSAAVHHLLESMR